MELIFSEFIAGSPDSLNSLFTPTISASNFFNTVPENEEFESVLSLIGENLLSSAKQGYCLRKFPAKDGNTSSRTIIDDRKD